MTAAPCAQGEAVVREAERLLDVREATGQNDGPMVAYILSRVDMPEGLAWCGALVYTAFELAGVQLPGEPRSYAWSPTWTASRVIWRASDTRTRTQSEAQPGPGDVFSIWFSRLGRVGHVGIVRDWQGDDRFLLTIEGNTNPGGSRDGDGVYASRRLKSQLHAVSRWVPC